MPRRIEYAKAHEEFIHNLVKADDTTGPFETKAKCLIFAAAFGASYGAADGKKPLPEKGSDRCEPIRYDVFQCQAFEDLICSLAVFASGDMRFLANTDEMADQRVSIFEQFAHRGLEKLEAELAGEINLTDGLMLLLKRQNASNIGSRGPIDWNKIAAL